MIRGQSEYFHSCRNDTVVGEQSCIFFIPIQQGSWKIGSKTDPIVTTFSAHNPVRGGITVLQSQDWFEGQALRGLIKGRVEQKKGGEEHREKTREPKNQPRKTELKKKRAEKTEHKSKYRETERTRGQDTVRRIILEIVFGPANKEKPGFSQRTLTTSRNLLCSCHTRTSRRPIKNY